MKKLGRLSSLFNLFVVLTITIVFILTMVVFLYERSGDRAEDVVIEIPKGTGLNQVAILLEENELVPEALFFRAMAYYEGVDGQIKYGEFLIPKDASVQEILNILVEGKAIQMAVTFPEGWTSFAMVQTLNQLPNLEGEITVIPDEGSLAPNTYAYLRKSTRQSLVDVMKAEQEKILQEAWENRAEDLPIKSKEELLILASIIEKETGTPEERGLVASVFVNRLNKGMKLQTDPTVIYGLTNGEEPLGRGLRQSELERETAYNTYVIQGLPPTPICNPGKDSILAAANPEESDYLYFVAKTANPRDGHNFAKTLAEHNKNVADYRAEVNKASQ